MSSEHEYDRGEEYCERGRVRNLIQEDGVYRAYVHRASYYLVKVWADGKKVQTSCSCNYHKEGICRHTVAIMIAIVKRETSESRAESTINLYEDGGFVILVYSAPDAQVPLLDEVEQVEEVPTFIKQPNKLVARDIVASPVGTLPENASIAQAWEFVQSRGVRHVPIVSDNGTIHGIISDRDLLRDAASDAISLNAKPLGERTVLDLVSPRLLTAGPETGIAQIARVLFEEHVGSIPIIDDQKALIGLITRSDILKAIVEREVLGSG